VHHHTIQINQPIFPELLPDVALQTGILLWFMHGGAPTHLLFMHDGAPTHFILAVWEFLKNMFLEQLVGRVGPTN